MICHSKMKLATFFGLFLTFSISKEIAGQTTDYCKASLCARKGKGVKHIACNNTGAWLPNCPSDAKLITLTPELKVAIVKKHNEYRNQIAKGGFSVYGPATRMATMRWNEELAKLATFNVKQCRMQHELCRSTDKFNFAGQNIALSGLMDNSDLHSDVMGEIQMWFDEYKDANMNYIKQYSYPTNGKAIGHFTQLVNDRNTDVGCAIAHYTQNGYMNQLITCNYPMTNMARRPVYDTGKAASLCKTGVNEKFKFLCSIEEIYTYTP